MRADALAPYERSLVTREPLHLVTEDGEVAALDIGRWLGTVDRADESVLARCVPPVLDIGCGPGRFVLALAERGMAALGLDIAPTAVWLTRRRGGPALRRSVFERTPGEGRWPTALLMDGNVGIDGDPERLLRRIRTLLTSTGQVLVEVHPDDDVNRRSTVRFARAGQALGPSFPWAQVGVRALCDCARSAGYTVEEDWSAGGRSFALLRA